MDETESVDKSNMVKKPNRLAIASVVIGFWGAILPFFAAIPTVICGHIVLSRFKNGHSEFSAIDKRLAIGGLVFGYFSIFFWSFMVFLFLADFYGWDLSWLFPYGIKI